MKQDNNLKDRYIQLVEAFINALESGKTGSELEDIRKEIRMLSEKIKTVPPVENRTQEVDFSHSPEPADERSNERI